MCPCLPSRPVTGASIVAMQIFLAASYFLSLALVGATHMPFEIAFVRGGYFCDVVGKISIRNSYVCPSFRASSHRNSRSAVMNTESSSPDSALWASLRKRMPTQEGATEYLPTADKMVSIRITFVVCRCIDASFAGSESCREHSASCVGTE